MIRPDMALRFSVVKFLVLSFFSLFISMTQISIYDLVFARKKVEPY